MCRADCATDVVYHNLLKETRSDLINSLVSRGRNEAQRRSYSFLKSGEPGTPTPALVQGGEEEKEEEKSPFQLVYYQTSIWLT